MSTFCFQLVWDLCACGQVVNFSHLVGISVSAKQLKDTDKPRHVLKSRDITLPTKVCLVKAMVFPVVVYGCESKRNQNAEELMLLNCGAGEDSCVNP